MCLEMIEKIMTDKDLDKTVAVKTDALSDIRKHGKFSIYINFIITKSLRGYYVVHKDRAHKVLADLVKY